MSFFDIYWPTRTCFQLAIVFFRYCEMPFASNTVEAEQIATAAHQRMSFDGSVPLALPFLAARIKEIVSGGEFGTIQRIEAWVRFPLLSRNDIRYNLSLANGGNYQYAGH